MRLSPIRIAEFDITKTAFSTRYGRCQHAVVQFGLTNATATFMNTMNYVLKCYTGVFVIVHLYNILIDSESLKYQKKHTKLVLDRLLEHKLYVKLSKSKFEVQEVEYLGFILQAEILEINLDKARAIEVWERPTTKKELQAF